MKKVLVAIPSYTGNLNIELIKFLDNFPVPEWRWIGKAYVTRTPIHMARNMLLKKMVEDWYDKLIMCFVKWTKVETIAWDKNIEEIQIWDIVKTHKWNYNKVIQLYKTPIKQHKQLLWISTINNSVICTPEHPFFIDWKFIQANKLKEWDYMSYPYKWKKDILSLNISWKTKYTNKKWSIWDIIVDRDFARFMWLYLAEWCWWDSAIRFTFNNNETEYIDFIKQCSLKYFAKQPTIYKRRATQVGINSRYLAQRFETYFWKRATDKKIPEFVFKWDLLNRLEFIKWYIDWDWAISPSWNATITTSSEKLVNDFIKLCNISWIWVNKYTTNKCRISYINWQKVNTWISYSCTLSKYSYWKLLDLLNGIIDWLYIKNKIVSIKNKKSNWTTKFVYNIEVERDNSYIANWYAVHNCDDDEYPIDKDCFLNLLLDDKDMVSWIVRLRTKKENLCILYRERYKAGEKWWHEGMWKYVNYKEVPKKWLFQIDNAWCWLVCISKRVAEVMLSKYVEPFEQKSVVYVKLNNWDFEEFWYNKDDVYIWKDWKPVLCRRTLSEDYLFFERAIREWFTLYADSQCGCVHIWQPELIYP